MKILQRYFAVTIFQAVAFVLVAFLALQAFMDLTGELPRVGKNGYAIQYVLLFVAVKLPGHVYEVMPLAALIGTIYTMAQFASAIGIHHHARLQHDHRHGGVDAGQDRYRAGDYHLHFR